MITYIISFPLSCSQVPQLCTAGRPSPIKMDKPYQGRKLSGEAPREAIPREGQVQVRRGLHLLSERRGQVLNTYQIRYKQFPRSRRSIRTLHIEADSLQNARINFLKAINLMKKLQHYTPFWCDHICIVDIWEVTSNGQTETPLAQVAKAD